MKEYSKIYCFCEGMRLNLDILPKFFKLRLLFIYNKNFLSFFKNRQFLPLLGSIQHSCNKNFFSSKFKKLNIYAIYNGIVLIFPMNVSMVFIFKFCIKKLWSNHQENLKNNASVKFDQKSMSYTYFSYQDKMTEMVDMLSSIFGKSGKKFKMKSRTGKRSFW